MRKLADSQQPSVGVCCIQFLPQVPVLTSHGDGLVIGSVSQINPFPQIAFSHGV